jgi:hypothetical protein
VSSPLPVLVSTVTQTGRNHQATPPVQDGVDAEEAEAVRAEGLDPDDPRGRLHTQVADLLDRTVGINGE